MFPLIPAIASAFSAIIAAVTSIGPAVAGFCATTLPKLAPLLAQGLEALQTVANIVNTVANVLGIFKFGETSEDMGDRALQAAQQSITPDKFDNYASYIEKLRDFELVKAKTEATSTEQKIVVGMAVAAGGLEDKFNTPEGTVGDLWALAAANPTFFTSGKLADFIKSGMNLGAISDYFEGKLGGGEALEVEDELLATEKTKTSDADDQSIREQIYGAAEAVQRHWQ